MWKAILTTFLIFSPSLVSAAGFVPCGGAGETPCQACHFVQLISSLSNWLVAMLGIIAVIIIILNGLRIVVSVGDVSAMTQSRKMISQMLVGYAIVLAVWPMVGNGLKFIASDSTVGSWNNIQCVAQPVAQEVSRPTASGDNATVLSTNDVASRIAAISSSGSLQTDIEAAAAAAGITDPAKVKALRALISQESSNCEKKVGPPTNFGTAYGCGQMLVSTARTLDAELKKLTDAEVADKLTNDNAYSLTLSAKYYSKLLDGYNNNIDLTLAAYNGGPGANSASADCPGQKRWQCQWDSPGCYNTGRTDCKKNEGASSYAQTRNYVSNINAIASGL